MEHSGFAIWSFFISIVALVIAIWGRIETYESLKRTRRIELVKRVGDALLASQYLSNKLEYQKELAEQFLSKVQITAPNNANISFFKEAAAKLKSEREEILLFLQAFEKITICFERGDKVSLEQTMIEAKIAHFNQRAALCGSDIEYLEREIGRINEENVQY